MARALLGPAEIARWRRNRWRARTDLVWLCNTVLNMPDVSWDVQGPFIEKLQKFPEPASLEESEKHDHFTGSKWEYRPLTPLYDLPGGRRVLILDPRGHLKTSCNIVAHTLQWILNYPDIAVLVVQSTNKKAEDFVFEVKQHFQVNPGFRALFPEHCPQDKVFDWGTRSEFTTEARSKGYIRKEATVMTASIDKGISGYHYDVMKFTDIVEANNSGTPEQCEAVIRSFVTMENLLVRPDSWIDIEGTLYHHSDLYCQTMERELEKEEHARRWNIHIRSCYKRKRPDGQPQKFIFDEINLPFELDESVPAPKDPKRDPDLRRIPWFPARFPVHELESRRLDPLRNADFNMQMLNNPTTSDDSPFPWEPNRGFPRIIPRNKFDLLVRIAYYEASVDTAYTTGKRSKFTAIPVVGWGEDGLPYIVEIVHKRLNPDQVIAEVLRVNAKYRPRAVKMEKIALNAGLMTGFRREEDMHPGNPEYHVPFVEIPRENDQRKTERILETLQPWYANKNIVFVDNCVCERVGKCEYCETMEWMRKEMTKFPLYEFNDILDALSDLFQERDWFGRERPRIRPGEKAPLSYRVRALQRAWDLWLGIEDDQPGALATVRGTPSGPYWRNITGT